MVRTRKNDFSQGGIAQNILSLAIPLTVAQLTVVLYNVVDRAFIGHIDAVGRDAFTGIGLVMPITYIINAFANLCGTGGAPLCSIARGQGDGKRAARIMGVSFTFLVLLGAGLTVLFYLFHEPFLYLVGGSPETVVHAKSYLLIYLAGTIPVMIGLGMNPFINAQLQTYGALTGGNGNLYVAAMTAITSVREIVFQPIRGLTQGAQPVIGYNYGAGQYSRVRECIRFLTAACLSYNVVIWLLLLAFPHMFILLFNDDPGLLEVGVRTMRVYYAAYVMMSFQMIGQNTFVALGRAKSAVCFSLLRKVALVTPLMLLLPRLWGPYGVFAAEPVSDVIGGLACYVTMMCTVWRDMKRPDEPLAAK